MIRSIGVLQGSNCFHVLGSAGSGLSTLLNLWARMGDSWGRWLHLLAFIFSPNTGWALTVLLLRFPDP